MALANLREVSASQSTLVLFDRARTTHGRLVVRPAERASIRCEYQPSAPFVLPGLTPARGTVTALRARDAAETRRSSDADILGASTLRFRACTPSRPMTRSRVSLAALLLLLASAAPAAGQGFALSSDSMRLTLSGRLQTIFNTTDVDGFASTDGELRRVRLEANVRVNPVVSGKIQPEYAGPRVQLKDAYVRLDLHPALHILAGQANRPFSLVNLTSSTRILPIERGVRIRGVAGARDHHSLLTELGYADRDVGLQAAGTLRGLPGGVSYAAGVFDGPLRGEVPSANGVQYVARIAARPAPLVRVGAAWSHRRFVEDPGANPLVLRGGSAWEADVEVGSDRGGPRLLAEVAVGDTDPFQDARFRAAQGWAAYRTGALGTSISAVEPFVRVSYGDPDADDRAVLPDVTGGTLVTPGVNLWLGGLNRVAVNWDAWNPETGPSASSVKVMFQLVF